MNFTLNLHLGQVKPPPVTPQQTWSSFVKSLLPGLTATDAAEFNFSLPCCAARYKPVNGTGPCDEKCNAVSGYKFNFTVADGLVQVLAVLVVVVVVN